MTAGWSSCGSSRRCGWEFLTDEGVGDGDLQPHPVPDLQAGLGVGHGRHHGGHVAVDVQVVFLMDAWQTCKQ